MDFYNHLIILFSFSLLVKLQVSWVLAILVFLGNQPYEIIIVVILALLLKTCTLWGLRLYWSCVNDTDRLHLRVFWLQSSSLFDMMWLPSPTLWDLPPLTLSPTFISSHLSQSEHMAACIHRLPTPSTFVLLRFNGQSCCYSWCPGCFWQCLCKIKNLQVLSDPP